MYCPLFAAGSAVSWVGKGHTMLDGTGLPDPILINTIGHMAGVLLFAVIIGLLVRDRLARGIRQIGLSLLAAVLALVWNIGSLIALASSNPNSELIGIVMSFSFSVLSIIPAVLLQVALRGRNLPISITGYVVSGIAVGMHVSELFSASVFRHQLGLIVIAVGFGVLAVMAALARSRQEPSKSTEAAEWLSLASLFLFTSSFLHFGYQHSNSPWTAEITWHHIGIPVVLIVLLRDYRFLLLDTFVRFLMNSALAVLYVVAIFWLNKTFRISAQMNANDFLTGLALVGLCLSLMLFAHTRNALQRWIGSVIFRRRSLEECIRDITHSSAAARSEDELLTGAARRVAAHMGTDEFSLAKHPTGSEASDQLALFVGGRLLSNLPGRPPWAEAQLPLHFSSGEICLLFTGSRRGRQRYLSEDLDDMRRLGSIIVEQVERFRSEELKRLATQAELRALQAQINPHFLFNALNTLYGTIDRSSYQARRVVLNLAEMFRYFLQTHRSFISLSEELRIVQAYLEIEALRLGDRLEIKLDIDQSAMPVMIPILCIQPIVENAVKHGIAPKQERGRITVHANRLHGHLRVSIEDTGVGFEASRRRSHGEGAGVGLDNVRRRLQLFYGAGAVLNIESSASGSTVSFLIPSSVEERGARKETLSVNNPLIKT